MRNKTKWKAHNDKSSFRSKNSILQTNDYLGIKGDLALERLFQDKEEEIAEILKPNI